MSEKTYALRKLRAYIIYRAKERKTWKPMKWMGEETIEDNLFAAKCRTDEGQIIIREIDRMLKMKQSGRKKKAK